MDSGGVTAITSIISADPERLARFYARAFGLVEIEAWRTPIYRSLTNGNGLVLGFNAPAAYELMGLEQAPDDGPVRTFLSFDVGAVAAVDESVDRLVALGASFVKGPYTSYYGARQAVFRDPEQNVVRCSHLPSEAYP